MRDYREVIIKFVKIVERHPEVYDSSMETYRTRHTDNAWEVIAESVRTELDEECTVEEIKTKWKGIRSSYNRFRNKLYNSNSEITGCKRYYLYDSLRFLEPFIRPKGNAFNVKERVFEDCGNYTNSDDDEKIYEDYESEKEFSQISVKTEVTDVHEDILNTNSAIIINDINPSRVDHTQDMLIESSTSTRKRRKEDSVSVSNDNTDSEDLQFFKSILPDIKDFSAKDKRKLKMGILKLIDDIESSRCENK